MQNGSSNHPVLPVSGLSFVNAVAHQSPTPGMVRVCFDMTPEQAHELAFGCTQPALASFAGRIEQESFWARWGRPNRRPPGVDMPRAMDPGE